MTEVLNLLSVAFRSAWRNLKKHVLFNLLNNLGLAITFASILLIGSYLFYENSFEDFHQKRDRIFRATYATTSDDFNVHWARVPVSYINQLPSDIPEINQLIRFQNQEQKYLRVGEKRFKPDHAYVTDPNVFDVFSFTLIAGNASTALEKPYSVVLTKSEALKIFSQTDVIGQKIQVSGDLTPVEVTYTITGIMDDLPSNTHLPVEMLFSFASEKEREGWAYVYVSLKDQANIESVNEKIADFIAKYQTDVARASVQIIFQPLSSIHLDSQLAREIQPNGHRIYLTIFLWFGLFIWVIGIINFSNVNLAITLTRGKEVGVRKILGAGRKHIALQLFGEAFFYSSCGLLIGLILASLFLPTLQKWTSMHGLLPLPLLSIALVGLSLGTAALTSIFPILYVTSVKVIQAIKYGKNMTVSRYEKINVRKGLIALQFCSAFILVFGTLITRAQLKYLSSKNLGLNIAQVLAIPNVPEAVVKDFPTFKNQTRNLPGVVATTACMQVPSDEIRDTGPVLIKGKNQDIANAAQMDIQIVDPDFIETMDLMLLAGQGFARDNKQVPFPQFNEQLTPTDYLAQASRKYVINETAMHQLGWNNPHEALGQEINFSIGGFNLAYGAITGIIKDYHQESLRNKIEPLVMVVEPIWLHTFLLKLTPSDLGQTVARIEQVWNDLFSYPMEYYFLDDLFDNLYRQDQTQVKLLSILSALAILVSLIGLTSLLTYTLKKRAKELAIRRVIGARQADLTKLVGKEYFSVFIFATAIAIPVSHWWSNQWLQGFSYQTTIDFYTFCIPIISFIILLFTIIWVQTLMATARNPIKYLSDE
ncbi:MAG: ABC transporter permease [Saprospiraceae bacterium]|nr:ABC transporter permease [Saprospiraceae bacterium]